jgi:hypothetical protein
VEKLVEKIVKNKSLYKKLMNLTESPAEKKKILNLMVKRGDKPEDAKKEIDKNYDYIKRTYKSSTPAKKAEILSSLSKFESVHKYTYGVGDVVKDINPTCPHNGAMGTVKSINPKSVVFMVINKGKNYKPGDVLDKTHDQMKKVEYIVGKKPVEERKNPKREKVKRDFLKNLKNTEKIIRQIKGYLKYNYWGDIGILVEDELVNNVRDLAKQTDIISKLPIEEDDEVFRFMTTPDDSDTNDATYYKSVKTKSAGQGGFGAYPAAYSSTEAKKMVAQDINTMSKILGKASQQVIKVMMNGVKAGKYDALDLNRGFKTGPTTGRYKGQKDFLSILWNKVRKGFRRYSKRGKLRR